MESSAALRTSAGSPLVPLAGVEVRPRMLTFILAIAAMGLVMTALTHAELRRSASAEPDAGTKLKGANVLTGLHALVWMRSSR